MRTPTRVLVLAGDALDDLLVRRWAADGALPTFRRLMAEGTWATTLNPVGLYVGALWASFSTGVSPARHGRYCHHQIRPGTYDAKLFLAQDLRAEMFWTALSRAGRRVAVVDVPKAPLTPNLNGIQLVDWGTHDPDPGSTFVTWPPELAADVTTRFGGDPVGPCDRVPRTPEALRALRDNLIRRIETKGRLACHYLSRGNWDLFLTVFNDPQCAGHQFWHLHDPEHPKFDRRMAHALGDPVRDVYSAIDAAMGSIIEAAGPETAVLVYGSHGMGPNYGGTFLLDEVLRRVEAARLPLAGLRRRAASAARWVWEHTPFRLGKLPGPVAQRLRDQLGAALPTLDVSGTRRCFQVPNNDAWGAIRVNLVGREPAGRVRPGAEYDRFCAQLAQDLRDLVDADSGRPFVRRIVRTDEVYPRRPDDDLPDLLIEWQHDRPIGAVTSPLVGTVRGRYTGVRTGDHRPDGWVIACGPVRAAGTIQRQLEVEDLAPTIAALLGVALEGVDGKPARELLEVLAASRPASKIA
jgi:predicted AlkP superfamily phosphohydrolase/phosphomutase